MGSVKRAIAEVGAVDEDDDEAEQLFEHDVAEFEEAVAQRKKRKLRIQSDIHPRPDIDHKSKKPGTHKCILKALTKNTKVLDQQLPVLLTLSGEHTADRADWKVDLTELGKRKLQEAMRTREMFQAWLLGLVRPRIAAYFMDTCAGYQLLQSSQIS